MGEKETSSKGNKSSPSREVLRFAGRVTAVGTKAVAITVLAGVVFTYRGLFGKGSETMRPKVRGGSYDEERWRPGFNEQESVVTKPGVLRRFGRKVLEHDAPAEQAYGYNLENLSEVSSTLAIGQRAQREAVKVDPYDYS